MMRITMALWILASVGALPAVARDYPFCIKGDQSGSSYGDCSFDTYQQCQASASGRNAYCDANPFFNGPGESEAPAGRHPHSRRRF